MHGQVSGDHRTAILAADMVSYPRLMVADERSTVAALDAERAVFRRHMRVAHSSC
jgi:class 3 adenylate cyclase